jgi:hypothetical protein
MPGAVLAGCLAVGWGLHTIAALVSGYPDPSYAYPQWLRIALGFGMFAVILLCSRMAQPRLATLAVWYWIAGIGVVTAALLPGFSPYFVFPAAIASILLLIQSRLPGAWTGFAGEVAIFLAAIPAMVIWLSLASGSEAVQGLAMHPLITSSVAFGAMTLIPLIAGARLARGTWLAAFGGGAALAVIVAVAAGMQPAFSAIAPQRLSITLLDDHIAKKASWVAETSAPLPAALRAAAKWGAAPQKASAMSRGLSWVAPAGSVRFVPPSATVEVAPEGKGRSARLTLNGSADSDGMMMIVSNGGELTSFDIGDQHFETKDGANPIGTIIGCSSPDCRSQTVTLHFATTKPVDVTIGEQRFGLPPDGQKIAAARPKEAVPSQNGDIVQVLKKITVR